MNINWLAIFIGGLFGASLFLADLANPDKIIGTLRLKDFHAMRTIAVFVIVGILGVAFLQLSGLAHLSVKPATLITVAIGGALLGIGFGMTGYCPGTGLACAAAGRTDALISVLGMFLGALAYIIVYPKMIQPLEAIANYGKATLPEMTHIHQMACAMTLVVLGTLILFLTARKKPTLNN